ncbi:hypothetical protein ACF0HT_14275 (plasmid) [Staphylococcus xylosus]|uniref:hypothetical protein n=1 Tax=Staphylococcus xylosus TaxID=1288 RepID=UPI002DB5A30C|nr:hypothetical protein [Staphylococcus xylosus]MEB8123166.1 hypothetical protein [Staphylococcus xylosus]
MGKVKNEITVNGTTYMRMYDDKGEFNNENAKMVLNSSEIEESIKELQEYDLMEVIKYKGVKYYRTLEPQSKDTTPKKMPFNVLNV